MPPEGFAFNGIVQRDKPGIIREIMTVRKKADRRINAQQLLLWLAEYFIGGGLIRERVIRQKAENH